MRILIVGATGALGREAVEAALEAGHDTAALVRDPADAKLPDSAELVAGDVFDRSSLREAVDGREAAICALGTPSPRQGGWWFVDAHSRGELRRSDRAALMRLVDRRQFPPGAAG